jgi:predicted HTH domain antitoxin
MATVTFDLPDALLAALPCPRDKADCEIRLAAALHWCSRGEISTGWAARLAGLTYADFLAEAARRKVELFAVDIEELKQALARPLPEGADVEKFKEELARERAPGR